jgi:1-acyl-sn-glycerol-3-phosphate acyltransferase
MMQTIWYEFMRFYIRVCLYFLHKKITVYGTENIPKKGAVLFIPNHQNALVDAILIPTTNKRNIFFLTRAAVFKSNIVAKFLHSLNMLPVYRIRDGLSTVENNIAIFQKCFEILKQKQAVEIFAEGEHHIDRRVLPLKKGFARIILGTLEKYPNTQIQIVPIGINFDSHLSFPSSVSIYYGKPILANDYVNPTKPDLKFSEISKVVAKAMKKLTLHINDVDNYDRIIQKLEANNIDYLDPKKANEMLKNIDALPNTTNLKSKQINWFAPIHFITKLNSIFPILIWLKLKRKITDILFTSTFRFGLIATIFPLFYLLQSGVIYFFFGFKYAILYLIMCIVLAIISKKTMQINSSL